MDKELEGLLSNYQPNLKTIEIVRHTPTLLLVGISGAGKDTIKKRLLTEGGYHLIISHTTRAPRKNHGIMERDGSEYHFITMEQAAQMLREQKFVEAKWVHRQNIYGTSSGEFLQAAQEEKIAVGDIEVQGVSEYIHLAPTSVRPIFLLPPNITTWQTRFKSRYEGQVGDGELSERVRTAREEIEHVLAKDYFSIVVNDNLDETVEQVKAISRQVAQSEAAIRHGHTVAQQLLRDMEQL